MSDSTALLPRCVTDTNYKDGFIIGGGYWDEERGCHLLLVDIRKEHIYWEKEIPASDGDREMNLSSILDSVLFFTTLEHGGDRLRKIATQRLDDENFQNSRQVNLNPKKINILDERLEYPIGTRIRPWKDGLILLNNYALFVACIWAAKPMESIKNYNVILVHGAADMRSGLDCKETVGVAYDTTKFHDPTDYIGTVGGYGSAWFWDENFHGGFLYQGEEESGATGMVRKLRNWLTENIFENDKRAVYLQRPFVNPAGSPFENGKEIGWSKWQGEKNCEVRRSLIEEAQEVKAKGRDNLKSLRENVENRPRCFV